MINSGSGEALEGITNLIRGLQTKDFTVKKMSRLIDIIDISNHRVNFFYFTKFIKVVIHYPFKARKGRFALLNYIS